jgi:hypothetical protein
MTDHGGSRPMQNVAKAVNKMMAANTGRQPVRSA